jgi:hypothetical protein
MSKGGKPAKPVSKKVLVLQDQLRRKAGVRELKRRILIVCEDDVSAPNYLEALKKKFKLTAASIRIVGSGSRSQPIQVVTRAIEEKDKSQGEASGAEPFEQVWCVIDGDYGAKVKPARKLAIESGIQLAISTPCFEYWVLLHFQEYGTSENQCNDVIHVLKTHIPDYEKGSCEFDDVVKEVHTAAERSRKTRWQGVPAEEQNPCSDMHLLIDAILAS